MTANTSLIRESLELILMLADALDRKQIKPLSTVSPQSLPVTPEVAFALCSSQETSSIPCAATSPSPGSSLELRELRSLFAETGFGDVLSPPPLPESSAPTTLVRTPPPRYSPEFLDLLLEIDAESDCSRVYECFRWPQSLERARTSEELASLTMIGKRFDVVLFPTSPLVRRRSPGGSTSPAEKRITRLARAA